MLFGQGRGQRLGGVGAASFDGGAGDERLSADPETTCPVFKPNDLGIALHPVAVEPTMSAGSTVTSVLSSVTPYRAIRGGRQGAQRAEVRQLSVIDAAS